MLIIIKSKKKHPPHTEKTIRVLREKLSKMGAKNKIATLEELEVCLEKNAVTIKAGDWIPQANDRVFIRVAEKYKNASFLLASYLKSKKIPFLDNFHAATRERNKLIQMFLLAANGVSIPKTYYSPVYDLPKIKNAIKFLGFPIVLKLTNEDRGEGVFLAKSISDISRIIKVNESKEIILQEFVDNSFDYRILVLGNSSVLGEKRTRIDKNDFRNNVSKGAKEEFLKLTQIPNQVKKISEKAATIMDIQICGVDVIVAENNLPYVIEANLAPSFTLNDSVSDELNLLSNYLQKWSEKK